MLQEKKKRDEGGMCEGRLQRRGNQPLLCRKVDLEELHFAVRRTILEYKNFRNTIPSRNSSPWVFSSLNTMSREALISGCV